MKNKKNFLICIGVILVILIVGFFIKNNQNTENLNSEKNQAQSDISVETEEPKANVEIIEKKDASYEEWLAAAMTMAISLDGEQFDIKHIYYNTETSLEDKQDSKGVYIIYEKNGKTMCIYSSPLKKERTKKGKTDLYTKDLGFATFDEVDKKVKDFKKWKEINKDSLSDLISQSMLVSLYEN